MILRTLLAFGYALSWVPIHVYRVEEHRQALSQYEGGERLMSRLTPAAITLHVILACILFSLEPPPRGLWLAAGLGLHFAGMAFWWWSRAAIGPLSLRRLPQEPPLEFRRDGPFGIVRHPLYSSYLLLCAAPVAAGHALLLPTFALMAAALAVRAVQEERRLRQQVGPAYDEYARRVKRLLPLVW